LGLGEPMRMGSSCGVVFAEWRGMKSTAGAGYAAAAALFKCCREQDGRVPVRRRLWAEARLGVQARDGILVDGDFELFTPSTSFARVSMLGSPYAYVSKFRFLSLENAFEPRLAPALARPRDVARRSSRLGEGVDDPNQGVPLRRALSVFPKGHRRLRATDRVRQPPLFSAEAFAKIFDLACKRRLRSQFVDHVTHHAPRGARGVPGPPIDRPPATRAQFLPLRTATAWRSGAARSRYWCFELPGPLESSDLYGGVWCMCHSRPHSCATPSAQLCHADSRVERGRG
jgi:hypothetical protein